MKVPCFILFSICSFKQTLYHTIFRL